MASPQEMLQALEDSCRPMDEQASRFTGLIYGQSGVGKTVEAMLLAQMITPPDKEIIFIDTAQGWISLLNHPRLKQRARRMRFQGLSQIELLVKAIQASAGTFANVGTVVFDEFSTVAKKDIHTVNTATGVGEFEASEFKQYNITTRRMEKVAWEILKLVEDCHLIFVAHERVDKNARTKLEQTAPSFMAQFAKTLKENMHVVARFSADIQHDEKAHDPIYVRTMQVHPSKMVVAKSRVGGMGVIVTPDFFNNRVKEWLDSGGALVDAIEKPVELASEKELSVDISDQVDFVGYELEEG